MSDEKTEPKFAPVVNYLADVFKEAWHKADELGEEGSRTRQGITAVIAALRTESDRYTYPLDEGGVLLARKFERVTLINDRFDPRALHDWGSIERAVWAARLRAAADLIEGSGARSQRVLDMFNGAEASDG